jgi:hypothetical protein
VATASLFLLSFLCSSVPPDGRIPLVRQELYPLLVLTFRRSLLQAEMGNNIELCWSQKGIALSIAVHTIIYIYAVVLVYLVR